MPLTKRQKKRLLEVSKMIESSIAVKDDMEDIQLEYLQEIDKIVNLIHSKHKNEEEKTKIETPVRHRSKTQHNVKLARELRKRIKREKEARDSYVEPSQPIVEDAPEWAKRLWKAIAKKCHPDRLSFQNISAIQIARRQVWFLEAKSLYEERSWPKLIHIGIQVGEYVEDITHKEQLGWLNNEYVTISNKITAVQKSLAWQWGTNWENIDLRIQIITMVLNGKGIKLPKREEIIELLLKLEVD